MKILLILAVLVAAAIGVWKFAGAESEAYTTYKTFAAAAAEQKWFVAEPLMGGGLTSEQVAAIEKPHSMFRGTLHGLGFERISEKPSADGGQVAIEAWCTVRFDPKGVHSGMGSAEKRYRQTATVSRIEGQWKVTSYASVAEKE